MSQVITSTSREERPKVDVDSVIQRRGTCSNRSFCYLLLGSLVLIVATIITFIAIKRFTEVKGTNERNVKLVLIFIPGLRWDTLDLMDNYRLGGFRHLKIQGVRFEYVDTVFPSFTVPSLVTIETGLYPEVHGILGNVMYDRKSKKNIDLTGSNFNHTWGENVEPIWATASKQGKRVAFVNWNNVPHYMEQEDASLKSFGERIDDVIYHLGMGVDFVMMSYDGVETVSQKYGPYSHEAQQELLMVAMSLESIFFNLSSEKYGIVHVMVVSDHGYEQSCAAIVEEVPRMMPGAWEGRVGDVEALLDDPPLVLLYVREGNLAAPTARHLLKRAPLYDGRLRQDIPASMHYKNGKFAPDALLYPSFAEPCLFPQQPRVAGSPTAWMGHGLETLLRGRGRDSGLGSRLRQQARANASSAAAARKDSSSPAIAPRVSVILSGMSTCTAPTLLLVAGPWMVGPGLVHPPLHLVDVYQIMAYLLEIKPQPNNGSWEAVANVLDKTMMKSESKLKYLKERFRITESWEHAFASKRAELGMK